MVRAMKCGGAPTLTNLQPQSLHDHGYVHNREGTATAALRLQGLNHGHLSCTTTGMEHDLHNRNIDHQETYSVTDA